MVDVSIVIVCMNKPKNLYPCLNSIKQYTNIVSYETFVVAYLFSEENLKKVKEDFPWVKFIESKEIRGFSENNNLALRQAKSKYCFVVNDDTEMKMPVIDGLVETMENLPENVAIVSPNILKADGSVQYCGRPRQTWKTVISNDLFRYNMNRNSPYINKTGTFKSYNILGAAFLIKTEIFSKFGWFDETYFFCPEDVALSTQLNEAGYECWVNADISIIHYEGDSGKSSSMIRTATKPAHRRGSLIFYPRGNRYIWLLMSVAYLVYDIILYMVYWYKVNVSKEKGVSLVSYKSLQNLLGVTFSKASPKEIFIKYYTQMQEKK